MRVPRLRFPWTALCLVSGVMISDTPLAALTTACPGRDRLNNHRRPASSVDDRLMAADAPASNGGPVSAVATVDGEGVALAAIWGSNQKLTGELERSDAENAELKQRLDALERITLSKPSQ